MFKIFLIYSAGLILIFSLFGYANEGGGEAKPAAEGEEGAAAAGGKKAPKDELLETRNEVGKRETKVKAIKEEIKKMMEEKNAIPQSEAQRHSEIMKLIEENYKKYRTEYEELQRARTRLRFRFPDKTKKTAVEGEEGAKAEHENKKDEGGHEGAKTGHGEKTLKEIEVESGLDFDLNQAMRKLREQYKSGPVDQTPLKKKKKEQKEESDSEIITIQK